VAVGTGATACENVHDRLWDSAGRRSREYIQCFKERLVALQSASRNGGKQATEQRYCTSLNTGPTGKLTLQPKSIVGEQQVAGQTPAGGYFQLPGKSR
jgi:hypothetical protein